MEGGKKEWKLMEILTAVIPSFLSPFSNPTCPSSTPQSLLSLLFGGGGGGGDEGLLIRLLRGAILLSLNFVLSLFFLLLSPAQQTFSSAKASIRNSPSGGLASPAGGTSAGRALAHVLSVVTRIPVASRKYELVRSLAGRMLDDNLLCDGGAAALRGLNRAVLSAAFARTVRRLESAVSASAADEKSSSGLIMGAVKSGMRKWSVAADEELGGGLAEKLAAEALWLGEKMAECGAAGDAVEIWGVASGLARVAGAAEPRLQVALVRVSAFMFRHANSIQLEQGEGKEESDGAAASIRAAMLTSWLPLLCRACNGTDTPTLAGRERAEMVRVLEEMIEKLSWEQQEEVLALWLHHFSSCPSSDWPNLESCYTRWYSESRKQLLR